MRTIDLHFRVLSAGFLRLASVGSLRRVVPAPAASADDDPSGAALLDRRATGPTKVPEQATSILFPEEKLQVRVGLAMSAAIYEETTANAVASFNLYRPWPRNDIEAELSASINYDSSREFNLTWPTSQGFAVSRHRLDQRNFLFIDQLVAVNDSTFSTQDDDDDAFVQFITLFGYGHHFWQGADPSSFQAVCSSAWGHAMNRKKST